MKVRIDDNIIEVNDVHNWGYLPSIDLDDGTEYEVAENSDSAGEKAVEYWEEMAHNDSREFVCMMGEERLLNWAMGKSDGFGCSSFQDFLELISHHPEETFGGYDGSEVEIEIDAELAEELGYSADDLVKSEGDEEVNWFSIVGYRRN